MTAQESCNPTQYHTAWHDGNGQHSPYKQRLEIWCRYTTAWRKSSLLTPPSSTRERKIINLECEKGFARNAEETKLFSNTVRYIKLPLRQCISNYSKHHYETTYNDQAFSSPTTYLSRFCFPRPNAQARPRSRKPSFTLAKSKALYTAMCISQVSGPKQPQALSSQLLFFLKTHQLAHSAILFTLASTAGIEALV